MPQFKPTFVAIPKEIKTDPERFGLQKDFWPPKRPSLAEVESCNQIALQENTTAMLTDEQFDRYTKAVNIIEVFKCIVRPLSDDLETSAQRAKANEEADALQTKSDIEIMETKIK